MGYWKCKECGGKNFYETISGGSQTSVFNKEGECIECYYQELDYDEVCCQHCDNNGTCIQDIAEWVEEE